MSKVRETIASNLSWSIVLLFGISAVALWTLLQEDLVRFLLSNPSKAIFGLGWIIAMLFLLLTGAIARLIFVQKMLSDPFKNYHIDSKTETVVDPKTGNRFCPNSKEGFKVLFTA